MKTILFAILLISSSAFATNAKDLRILTPGAIRNLIGNYPALGTEASHRDYDILLHLQNTRSPEECSEAKLEENASLESMFAGPKGPLTKKEMKIVSIQLLGDYAEIGANIYLAKKMFKRPRPYLVDSKLTPCIDRESSYAYPSGHTATAHYMAQKLIRIYPARKAALLKRAEEISWNRVLGGVHHPSDIEAGKKLGLELASLK
ncbi:MAG: phosphatase PAP2 family protein [Bdellovibrionota bacterium]